jgi:hypothetical protein
MRRVYIEANRENLVHRKFPEGRKVAEGLDGGSFDDLRSMVPLGLSRSNCVIVS